MLNQEQIKEIIDREIQIPRDIHNAIEVIIQYIYDLKQVEVSIVPAIDPFGMEYHKIAFAYNIAKNYYKTKIT